MIIKRGFRCKLEDYCDLNSEIEIETKIVGSDTYNCCCFGVDINNKLVADEYMVFYNNSSAANGAIKQSGDSSFTIIPGKIPSDVYKLAFTASSENETRMGNIASFNLLIKQNGVVLLEASFTGKDFSDEKALTCAEIYCRDGVWRIQCVASGFNGGLRDLLLFYGGECADDADSGAGSPVVPVTAAPPAKISLEKKLEKAPALISLAKPLSISLKKHNLENVTARVALVMDISGSMNHIYKVQKKRSGLLGSSGPEENECVVQQVINRIIPLAIQFDNDGSLEFWYYGTKCQRQNALNIDNFMFATDNWKEVQKYTGGCNNEPVVMREVIDEFKNSDIPAYVIFITDGGVSQARKIENLVVESSNFPIFWKFIGLKGSSYGVLERLDDMPKVVDNADFFSCDDFETKSPETLYNQLLDEFPQWLMAARSMGIIK
ncbi:MAG: VWA domain-containing protein [Oscillospiraceae bacterium]|nr:VWA domain-containing protein [Oscillospiraceae bacterium]